MATTSGLSSSDSSSASCSEAVASSSTSTTGSVDEVCLPAGCFFGDVLGVGLGCGRSWSASSSSSNFTAFRVFVVSCFLMEGFDSFAEVLTRCRFVGGASSSSSSSSDCLFLAECASPFSLVGVSSSFTSFSTSSFLAAVLETGAFSFCSSSSSAGLGFPFVENESFDCCGLAAWPLPPKNLLQNGQHLYT